MPMAHGARADAALLEALIAQSFGGTSGGIHVVDEHESCSLDSNLQDLFNSVPGHHHSVSSVISVVRFFFTTELTELYLVILARS